MNTHCSTVHWAALAIPLAASALAARRSFVTTEPDSAPDSFDTDFDSDSALHSHRSVLKSHRWAAR